MHRWVHIGVASLLMLFVLGANAQTRAWLDRDRIALGDLTLPSGKLIVALLKHAPARQMFFRSVMG